MTLFPNRLPARARIVFVLLIVVWPRLSARAVECAQSFPGAVGQGAVAVGGRGGDVYHVVTLEDYNPKKDEPVIAGSLRDAIKSAQGPRTIIFDVGGGIKLHGILTVDRSKLTGGPDVTFETFFPRPGSYRIWSQFQRSGRLMTVSFSVAVPRLR